MLPHQQSGTSGYQQGYPPAQAQAHMQPPQQYYQQHQQGYTSQPGYQQPAYIQAGLWQPHQGTWQQPSYSGVPQRQQMQQQMAPAPPAAQPDGWAPPPVAPHPVLPALVLPPQPSIEVYAAQPPLPEGPPLPLEGQQAAGGGALPPLPPEPPLPAGAPPLLPHHQQLQEPLLPLQQSAALAYQQQPAQYLQQQYPPQQPYGSVYAYPPEQQQPHMPPPQQQHGMPGYQQHAQQPAVPAQYPSAYQQQQQQQPYSYLQQQASAPPGQYSGGWVYGSQQHQPAQLVAPPYQTGIPPADAVLPGLAAMQPPPGAAPQRATAQPAPAAAAQPLPQLRVDALSLLQAGPARQQRPKRLVVLLRGLPGSGKSHVARLIREQEVAAGGEPPRILSLDDYFMTEVEREVEDGEEGARRGRKRKVEVLEYCFEAEMEGAYQRSLLKAFQRAVEEARYHFIVVDAPAHKVADFKDYWSTGQAGGYEVYVAQPPESDPQVCFARCTHGRSKEDVYRLSAEWEPTPPVYTLLLLDGLLGRGGGGGADGGGGIAEVEMVQEDEDAGTVGNASSGNGSSTQGASGGSGKEEDEDKAEVSPGARPAAASRWAVLGSEGEGQHRTAPKKKKKRGSKGGLAVDDWRELLAGGKQQQLAATCRTPRSILSKGGSAAPKKRVRWPDKEAAAQGSFGEDGEDEEQGFRFIGGAAIGTPAKSGLEVVHVLHGLGPPAELHDGDACVALHPGSGTPPSGRGFAAAALAEHHTEANLFRHLLLSRGGAA